MRLTNDLTPRISCSVCVSSADDIEKRIYTNYLNDGYCVRLTHQTGSIGCAGERVEDEQQAQAMQTAADI
jgi:hypothetical protein